MIFTVNGKEYIASWKHTLPDVPKRIKVPGDNVNFDMLYIPRKSSFGSTECVIKDKETKEIIATARTICSKTELWEKSVGRYESLAKVLEPAGFTLCDLTKKDVHLYHGLDAEIRRSIFSQVGKGVKLKSSRDNHAPKKSIKSKE